MPSSDMEHISDEDLERYYLGMVKDETELAPLEEHLLWCHGCIDRAEVSERFVDAMRVALLRVDDD
jgi:hypothetical protein